MKPAKNTNRVIRKLESQIPRAFYADRYVLRRDILALKRNQSGLSEEALQDRLNRLSNRVERSSTKRSNRFKNIPKLNFDSELPIVDRADEILEAIRHHQVVIISGETGSGKTTQIPKLCLAAGRGVDGMIGCTQPRRIAATTVARRIADELGEDLGQSVGYKIRFQDRTSPDAYIKLMTDGILLAETQTNRLLHQYDTLIVDEAHERSLNIDFVLGLLKSIIRRRKDLKLIITSATIDTEKFSKAFGGAPIIEVSGRMYPVEIRYLTAEDLNSSTDGESEEPTPAEMAARAVDRLQRESRMGDILVFMPSEQDIRETCETLEGRHYMGTTIFPLYARLSAGEQARVFSRPAGRKIIVATNIAETSITIPGIRYVVDTGLARIPEYSPRTRTTSLPVKPVSRSSADQRAGRCGRVENGICVRLYSEPDYESRPLFTPPEILRANLADVILRMISLKLGRVEAFPFIDMPSSKSIQDGFDLLGELGAIRLSTGNKQQGKRNSTWVLTRNGRLMAKMPIDPRLSRMLIEADSEGCLDEIAVIAASLSIQDPRERPAEKAGEADRMHEAFKDPASDFITRLNIWTAYQKTLAEVKSQNQMKRFCRTHFLSFKRMREWRDIYNQIVAVLDECRQDGIFKSSPPRAGKRTGIKAVRGAFSSANSSGKARTSRPSPDGEGDSPHPLYGQIHRSILSGFLSNIAVRKDKNWFNAAKNREVMIFPGSGLFNQAGSWIVAAEMVQTSRLFARICATIDSRWLERLGGDLCRSTYSHPHWERKRGEVVASERVSLFGLTIIDQRTVSYGRINPGEANELFIRSALVDGDVRQPLAFMTHNQNLIEKLTDMEDRLRKRDILVDEQALFEFYKKRLPGIFSLHTLRSNLKKRGDDRFLRMTAEDLCQYLPDEEELSLYPSAVTLGDRDYPCQYRFEPGADEDGVTIRIPSSLAPTVPADAIDWLVPGLFREKITALIKGLPKMYRKQLVPVSDTVERIVQEMPRKKAPLVSALGQFIFKRFGIDIPSDAWSGDQLPEHLIARIMITGSDGEVLYSGRDRAELHRNIPGDTEPRELQSIRANWERKEITRWDFGELPESISFAVQNGEEWAVFPALETDGQSIQLRIFRDQRVAAESHRRAVGDLTALCLAGDMKYIHQHLNLPRAAAKKAGYFGGARRFEKMLRDSVVQNLFSGSIRSEDAFQAHLQSVRPRIHPFCRELLQRCVAVLDAYEETRSVIFGLEYEQSNSLEYKTFFEELRSELNQLVSENFAMLYSPDRLRHLVRYVTAVGIRAQRAVVNFDKDKARASEIRFFTDNLNELLQELSPLTSTDKRTAIESFFWLIEEYKVSLFAQELRTAVPVSKKRLMKKLEAIRRMV